MYLGTVTGRVVSTVKDSALEARTLLLVRRHADGKTVVAVDSVGAGAGERVYVCRGREASFAFRPDDVPSDATIVGIVDSVDEVRDEVRLDSMIGDVVAAVDGAGADEDR